MPELPEVETIRRSLAPILARAEIVDVIVRAPHVTDEPPARFRARLLGRRVEALGRRGKFLVVRLDGGVRLALHLRMTGRLVYEPPAGETAGAPPASATPGTVWAGEGRIALGWRPAAGFAAESPHTHLEFRLSGGGRLLFHDVRKFGRAWTWLVGREPPPYAGLGPEPLGRAFTPERLARSFAGRRSPVKALLLDQRVVAGIGNIYADEALWLAAIHPGRPAGELGPAEVVRLRRAIRSVLGRAIDWRGTTLRDYRDGLGEAGGFAPHLRVYGRAGAPCARCGTAIVKTTVAQRGTHFCPRCQPEPRA